MRTGLHGPVPVDRLAQRVDHAPQPAAVRTDERRGISQFRARADPNPVEVAEWHQQGPVVAEPDDLARHMATPAFFEVAAPAHGK